MKKKRQGFGREELNNRRTVYQGQFVDSKYDGLGILSVDGEIDEGQLEKCQSLRSRKEIRNSR